MGRLIGRAFADVRVEIAAAVERIVWRATVDRPVCVRRRHRSCRSGLGLCRFETGEQHQVVRDHRGPDVGLEVIEPAPSAAGQTIGALQAGDPGLDPGAEVAQLAIDPAALDHVFDRQAAFL